MKTIKVWYCDFYEGFDFEETFGRFLRNKFNLILDKDNPDVVFYSVFGKDYVNYLDKILIFYTGECITPDFNICDYAIGFDYLEYGDRYLRYPLYKLYLQDMKRLRSVNHQNNKKFCCFVVSNAKGMPERQKMFDLLNQYKRVDSGGKFLNNLGYSVQNKHEFQSNYKFCICFENCIYDGYTTEKIIQAFGAGCIPVYLGNPLIAKEFNPKSFVNCHDFSSLEEACEYVKKIDNDDNLYNEIISNINFKDEIFDENPLSEFLNHIFSQDLKKAKRAPNGVVRKWFILDPLMDARQPKKKPNRLNHFLEHSIKTIFRKLKSFFKH